VLRDVPRQCRRRTRTNTLGMQDDVVRTQGRGSQVSDLAWRRKDPLMSSRPDIVLIHGLWLTPLSWEGWKQRFESKGQ